MVDFAEQNIEFFNIPHFSESNIAFIKKNVNPNINIELANWEFVQPSKRLIFCVLKHNDEIKGSQGLIHVEAYYKGKIIRTGKSECTFLDSSFRGTNAFYLLYNHFLKTAWDDGISIVWGLTSAIKIWREKLAFDVADMCIYDMSVPKSLLYNKHGKRSWFFKKASQVLDIFENNKNYLQNFRLELIPSLSENDILWKQFVLEKLNTPFYIGTHVDYYNWRIKDNPYLTYQIWKIYKNNSLSGYIVISTKNQKVIIHEWITDDIIDIPNQLKMIQKHLVNYDQTLYYFGNITHPINKAILSAFQESGGKSNLSNWAGLVAKSHNLEVNAQDLKNGLINFLWTEGVK